MEHRHQPRKFVLRTTCLKNGGFRKYQPLPPQEVFQHAYWVLGSEMDVKIKRKQTLFNRETDWMFLPVYLTTNKGLLFVYITNDSGYVLRISSALKLNFEGTKKAKKRQQTLGPNFTYLATIVLQFHFGELHLRFNDCENLRPWRAILLASHQSQNGVSKIAEYVGKEIFGSTSLESVVSTKSVYPENDDKDKTERVEIHRHPMIASNESVVEQNGTSTVSPTSLTSTSMGSSTVTKTFTKSPKCIKSISDVSPFNAYEIDDGYRNNYYQNNNAAGEAESNESLLDRVNFSATSFDKNNNNPFSPTGKSSHLTSEVNVSFEDLDPLSVISNTAAFKTSPTQISDDRFSRISTISTSSYFAGSNADKKMRESILGLASSQIPFQQKPEAVVEEINQQFEPLKPKMLTESAKLQPQPLHPSQTVTFAKSAPQQPLSLSVVAAQQLSASYGVEQPTVAGPQQLQVQLTPQQSHEVQPQSVEVSVSATKQPMHPLSHSDQPSPARELPGLRQDVQPHVAVYANIAAVPSREHPYLQQPHVASVSVSAVPPRAHQQQPLHHSLPPHDQASPARLSRDLASLRQSAASAVSSRHDISPRVSGALPSRGQQQYQPLRTISRRDQTTIPLTVPPRNPLPKPPQVGMHTNSKPSKVLEFWRQKETQSAGQLPIHAAAAGHPGAHSSMNVPVSARKVRFEEESLKSTAGKTINSPTKYYANIEDVSESPSSAKFQSESHI